MKYTKCWITIQIIETGHVVGLMGQNNALFMLHFFLFAFVLGLLKKHIASYSLYETQDAFCFSFSVNN